MCSFWLCLVARVWAGYLQISKNFPHIHHKRDFWMVRLQLLILMLGREHHQQMFIVRMQSRDFKTSKYMHRTGLHTSTPKFNQNHHGRFEQCQCYFQVIGDIIEMYLLNQGNQTMEDCIKPNSKSLHLSANICNLGWDCFVEGWIP